MTSAAGWQRASAGRTVAEDHAPRVVAVSNQGGFMRSSRAVRLLTVMALAVPASLAVWAVSGPASAAAPASCSTLTGNDAKSTSVVSGCVPTSATGGKGNSVSKTGKGTTGTST